MIVGTAGVAIWLWTQGQSLGRRGCDGGAADLADLDVSGWVARNVTSIFENIGTVQDGMRSIAVPRQMPDKPDATELTVTRGAVRFENVHFGYDTSAACCTASTSQSRRASASASSARQAPANRPWSICCCASTSSKAAAS